MAKHKHGISEKPLRPRRKAAGSDTRRESQGHRVATVGIARNRKCLLFCAWFAFFTVWWLFANWRRSIGRAINESAGFPLQFADWTAGEMIEFQVWKLCFDIGIGLVTVLGTSWICVKSASASRTITDFPKDPALTGVLLMLILLLFSPVYFALVDYNQGYLGRLAGLYSEAAKPAEDARDPFPKKE